jgi:hypothetical protein
MAAAGFSAGAGRGAKPFHEVMGTWRDHVENSRAGLKIERKQHMDSERMSRLTARFERALDSLHVRVHLTLMRGLSGLD